MFIRIENICIFLDTNNTFFCFITKKVAYYSSSNPRRNCSRAVAPPVLAKESRQYYSVDYSVGTHGRNHVNLGRSSGPDPTSDFEVWPLTFPGDSYMVSLVQSQGAIISNDLVTSQFTSFIRKHNVTIKKQKISIQRQTICQWIFRCTSTSTVSTQELVAKLNICK